MICPKCSAEIPDDSIFCLNCGASLNDAQADVQTEAAPAAELPHYLDPGGFSYKLREQLKSPMFLVILQPPAFPILIPVRIQAVMISSLNVDDFTKDACLSHRQGGHLKEIVHAVFQHHTMPASLL